MTHAGHSYAGRSVDDMARIAEAERAGVVRAAERLRAARARRRRSCRWAVRPPRCTPELAGVTEVRAGVYMFGDLFQAEIGTHGLRRDRADGAYQRDRPRPGRLLVDAGGLALSKDRSTAATPKDYGFGLVLDMAGKRSHGDASCGEHTRSTAWWRLIRLPARSAGRRQAADCAEPHLHDSGGA